MLALSSFIFSFIKPILVYTTYMQIENSHISSKRSSAVVYMFMSAKCSNSQLFVHAHKTSLSSVHWTNTLPVEAVVRQNTSSRIFF